MIGFIGCGNMASAIVKGLVSSGLFKGDEIALYDLFSEKANTLSSLYGAKVMESESAVAESCDIVVLAVKPNVIATVLNRIDSCLKLKNPLVISIAAGKTLDFISDNLSYDARLARVMPNINASVGAAVSGYCVKGDENDRDFVRIFCESFGTAVEIAEKDFSIFSAIGGCSPAFCYMFIDSLARAGVKNGLTKAKALEVAAGAVLGSAKMVLQSEEHPWELVDKVCSPGGTTIEGVSSLQESAFESAVIRAVEASYKKDNKV